MCRSLRAAFCVGPFLVAVLLGGGSAYGHKLKVFATAEGRTIRGCAYFPGGGRAKKVKVEVFDPAGDKLGETTTDERGEFTFEARFKCDHKLVVDTGDHRATRTVKAVELPDDLPSRGGPAVSEPEREETPGEPPGTAQAQGQSGLEAMMERAVSRQVRPLREQIEAYEEKRRLHDILGGIGYIVGVTGIAFYFLGARRKKASPPPSG